MSNRNIPTAAFVGMSPVLPNDLFRWVRAVIEAGARWLPCLRRARFPGSGQVGDGILVRGSPPSRQGRLSTVPCNLRPELR